MEGKLEVYCMKVEEGFLRYFPAKALVFAVQLIRERFSSFSRQSGKIWLKFWNKLILVYKQLITMNSTFEKIKINK